MDRTGKDYNKSIMQWMAYRLHTYNSRTREKCDGLLNFFVSQHFTTGWIPLDDEYRAGNQWEQCFVVVASVPASIELVLAAI